MKLILDQGLPWKSAELLRVGGVDAIHVAEMQMSRATDVEILARALAEKASVVTLDADFHTLLAQSGAALPSVIRIREERVRHEEAAEMIRRIVELHGDDLQSGVALSVTRRTIRVRRLPLGTSRDA